MELEQNTIIKVINEGTSPVVASGRETEYTFESSKDGSPFELEITFNEVKFINQKSSVFKEGLLSFSDEYSEEEKGEIYGKLYIPQWKNILSYKEIAQIILNPTKEGLNKLLSVSTFIGFERIRGVFTRQSLIKNNDVSIRVKDLINARSKEIAEGKLLTSLIVTEDTRDTSKVNALEDEVKALKEMLAKLTQPKETIIEEETKEEPKKTVKKSTKTA